DVVKICFDTGHTVVGGGDPVELARLARDRIAPLPLKDVEPRVLHPVRSREVTVEGGWGQKLVCPLGRGARDSGAGLAAPGDYDGWAVIEQDRVAVRPDHLDAVRETEVRNLEAVRQA